LDLNNSDPLTLGSSFLQAWICASKYWLDSYHFRYPYLSNLTFVLVPSIATFVKLWTLGLGPAAHWCCFYLAWQKKNKKKQTKQVMFIYCAASLWYVNFSLYYRRSQWLRVPVLGSKVSQWLRAPVLGSKVSQSLRAPVLGSKVSQRLQTQQSKQSKNVFYDPFIFLNVLILFKTGQYHFQQCFSYIPAVSYICKVTKE
jgi:hypothetical protein